MCPGSPYILTTCFTVQYSTLTYVTGMRWALEHLELWTCSLAAFRSSPCEPFLILPCWHASVRLWHLPCPTYDLHFVKHGKSRTFTSLYKQYVAEMASTYPNYIAIYVDGSLVNRWTGFAFVCNNSVSRFQLNNHSSVYTAKLCAVH
jgi:hypothetical protein